MYSNQGLLMVGLFLVFGTLSAFTYKLQTSVTVQQGSHVKNFFHPYMQCFTMFIGQAISVLVYFATRKENDTPLEQGKKPHKPWIFAIPALSDGIGSTLGYMALCFMQSSTWMIMRGCTIVFTLIFSKLLLKTDLEMRHFVSCGLAVSGVIVVGLSGLLQPHSAVNQVHDHRFLGYALKIGSIAVHGFHYAYEQYLMTKHSINPTEMVGFEGCFGMILSFSVALTLSFVPCYFGQQNCVYNYLDEAFMESPAIYAREVFSNHALLILVIMGIVAINIFTLNGSKITKVFDALTRSLLQIVRTFLVWLVGLIVTLFAAGNKQLQIQSLNLGVNLIKALGFAMIIFGTLIYNKIILKEYFEQKNQQEINQFKDLVENQAN